MKTIALGCFFLLFFAGMAFAQSTPVTDQRQKNQRQRIQHGVASGEVTRSEAVKMRADQRHIKRAERRAKADDEVTPKERVRIQRQQNKASRRIAREKHDAQDRPGAN